MKNNVATKCVEVIDYLCHQTGGEADWKSGRERGCLECDWRTRFIYSNMTLSPSTTSKTRHSISQSKEMRREYQSKIYKVKSTIG